MKKTMILAAFAALISLASCQKEEVIDNGTDKNASPVFTASIAGATKTTIDLTNGKVAWETTDEITVTDAASASAVYTIESIDATTGKATFAIKSGETALGAGPYTATYGTEPATAQTYSATAGKLYMAAPKTSNNSFTFTVQCGLMEINLTKSGKYVRSIAVTGTPTGGIETTYTLTCGLAQGIAEKRSFYIAVPAGRYNKIMISDTDKEVCTLTASSGIAVEANHIKPLTFGQDKLDFIPAGALQGVFTVADYGSSIVKKVHFSKGNLWVNTDSDTPIYSFETNQYDVQNSWSKSHVSHFYWSKGASIAYAEIFSDPSATVYDVFFTNASNETVINDFKVYGISGRYRTLSKPEWQHLLDTRTVNGSTGEGKSYQRATINSDATGVYGLILYPDNYTEQTGAASYTSAQWIEMETAGCVFLPAAGERLSNSITNGGSEGSYWSSECYSKSLAYCVTFSSSKVSSSATGGRFSRSKVGYSVRLVSDVI